MSQKRIETLENQLKNYQDKLENLGVDLAKNLKNPKKKEVLERKILELDNKMNEKKEELNRQDQKEKQKYRKVRDKVLASFAKYLIQNGGKNNFNVEMVKAWYASSNEKERIEMKPVIKEMGFKVNGDVK